MKIYVGSDIVGTSTLYYHDITRYVQPGWSLEKIERGENTFSFSLGNPNGKFTDSTISEYMEISEDFPIVLTYNTNIYYHGLVFRPPVTDNRSGTTVSIESTSRLYLFKKEDVIKRYTTADFETVEDVIYDIIYNATALNSYYGVTYDVPEIGDRHKFQRNFIFNNKDAETCVKELLEYHNLNISMSVDTSGADVITLSRTQVKNKPLALSKTLDDSNTRSINRKRGSDVFFNKVKAIGRSEDGTLFVGQQQDLYSIQTDGLRVRPTEDIGTVEGQLTVQRYAEYLIGKYSRDNYTTDVVIDPTKFDNDDLWAIDPLDIIKITSTRTGIGTNQKMRVVSVSITGSTDELTDFTIQLNHVWRSVYYMQFEEMPTVYDDEQAPEDEELIDSRIMTAIVDVTGAWNLNDGSDNWHPTTSFNDGGAARLTDMGRMLIKTNWLRDPEYTSNGLASNPLTMRISTIWPLNKNGNVIGNNNWSEHADGWDDEVGSGADGSDYYWTYVGEYNITTSNAIKVHGALACSRYGGQVVNLAAADLFESPRFTFAPEIYVDDPQFLRPGMNLSLVREEGTFIHPTEFGTSVHRVVTVDYDTGLVNIDPNLIADEIQAGTLYWYADCYPVAEFMFETPQDVATSTQLKLRYNLRFTNHNDTYSPDNLSVVTKEGLESIANRLRYSYFNETPHDNIQLYPPPTFLSIGLNDIPTVRTAVDDDHTALNHEIARTTYLEPTMDDETTVSDSAKVTAKFTNLDIPPVVVRSPLSAAVGSTEKEIYVDDNEGFAVGDHVYFSADGGTGWTYTEAVLRPNIVESIGGYVAAKSGYGLKLRHAVGAAKTVDTIVTTGKIGSKTLRPIKEIALWNKEAIEHSDTGYFFGEQTANLGDDGFSAYKSTIITESGLANSGMGFGDFQYDDLDNEDTTDKEGENTKAPYYFGPQAASTFDYIKGVTGYGFTTVPLSGLRSGKLGDIPTYNTETTYGRTPSLQKLLFTFRRDISGTGAAAQISPLAADSHSLTQHVGKKEGALYFPSKWRLYKGWSPKTEKGVRGFSTEVVMYENYYAAELYTFSVNPDITRKEFKDLNLVWRGTAKSYDGSDYRDGMHFYVWHHGDAQPEYFENEEGVFEVIGRVGDARTYYPHWDRVKMVGPDGEEVDTIIGGTYNAFNILTSQTSPGEDNHEGINKAGYYLSEGGRIFVLAVTKYKADYSTKKLSSIHTDFIGLTVGTSHILEGQEIAFQQGIDYFYDPEWDFIAWPNIDLYWQGPPVSEYKPYYNLTEVGEVMATVEEGSYVIYHNIPPGTVHIDDVLVLTNGDTQESVVVGGGDYGLGRLLKLTGPLNNRFITGSKIYKHIFNTGPARINVLNKEVKSNYPSRTFALQGLTTSEGYSSPLNVTQYNGGTTWTPEDAAGFRNGDQICILRYPNSDNEYRAGYEWGENTEDGEVVVPTGIQRDDIDDNDAAYSVASQETVVGVVDFDCPIIDTGMALSWNLGGGTWDEGDANGSKWKAQNNKWHKRQYPFIEGKIKGANLLTSNRDPFTSVGTGYSNWDTYGGPGVKIEYYDKTNGKIWVTKAIDMTIRAWSAANTDTSVKIDDYVFTHATLDFDNQFGTVRAITPGPIAFGHYYAYGNRTGTEQQATVHIARNSYIEIDDVALDLDTGTEDLYVQFALAECTTSGEGYWGNNHEFKPKYRALEATVSGAKQTCKKYTDDQSNLNKKYWLDAPFFDHENIATYDYHDATTGQVFFVLDTVSNVDQAGRVWTTEALGAGVSAGAVSLQVADSSSPYYEINDFVLIREGNAMEIVQVISRPDSTHIGISPGVANDYTTSATLDVPKVCGRVVIAATQVYEPIGTSDLLNLTARIFRGAQYEFVYGEETGDMLVYSLLKDGTIHRPIETDRADSVQIIQEVKFNYLEKDLL